MKINKHGYWENSNSNGHIHDSGVSSGIIDLIKKNSISSVVDFGCGMGDYAKKIIEHGVYCEAYDGNPNTSVLTKGIGKVIDLSSSFELERKFDCVVSLEVGEHIPKEYEEVFIKNICIHAEKLIILSWAVVGQAGHGHVNCKSNDEIIKKLENMGFIYDFLSTNYLRNCTNNALWFKNTIMVFFKK